MIKGSEPKWVEKLSFSLLHSKFFSHSHLPKDYFSHICLQILDVNKNLAPVHIRPYIWCVFFHTTDFVYDDYTVMIYSITSMRSRLKCSEAMI